MSRMLFCKNSPTELTARVFIVCLKDFLSPVPSPDFLRKSTIVLRKGQSVDTVRLGESLARIGYFRVPKASVAGEFALRGEVLDIVLPGGSTGLRVTFDFDQIEKIKTFHPDTQATDKEVQSALVVPMKEFLFEGKNQGIRRKMYKK